MGVRVKLLTCVYCGSTSLIEEYGYVVCTYCRSKHVPEVDEVPAAQTTIQLASDIDALLHKCRQDPSNAHRYASLILDIDPTNTEALRFLRETR